MAASKRKKLRKIAPRGNMFHIRLSERELEMLQAVVDAEGMKASELVRQWLRAAHDGLKK